MKNKNAVKILLGLMLCLCMIFQLAPMSANALDSSIIAHGDNCGADGADLTWTLDSDGTLTISGTGAMMDWESFNGAPWYSKKSNIKKVVIEDGVTTIGDYAFYDCHALPEVTIPDSVTAIGKAAFGSCDALTKVIIPNGVTAIGTSAFYYCNVLSEVSVACSWDKENPLYDFGSGVAITTRHAKEDGRCDCGTVLGYCGADEDGKKLRWSFGHGVLTVFGQGAMSAEPAWKEHEDEIIVIVIENDDIEIPAPVFDDCSALKLAIVPCT